MKNRQIDPALGHWLAGLVDGEGCFVLYVRQRKDRPSARIDLGFKLSLRADDGEVIDLARKLLGVQGSVYTSKHDRGGNGKPLRALAVYAKDEIRTVVSFFRRFRLRSKKARDFEIWAAAFEYFDRESTAGSVRTVALGVLDRPSAKHRRAPAGTRRQRFYAVPVAVVERMEELAKQLKETRRYR